MTCPMTVRLGVYALGAADAKEREAVASHLPACPGCRAEMARLEPLPGLLAQVPESRWAAGLPAAAPARPGRVARGRSRPWRALAATAAAAAAAGVTAGAWLAQPGASPSRPAITASGANPATHVRATVSLTGTSWGTSIRLVAQGLPLNVPCRLIVRSRTGGTQVTGVWDAWSKGPVSVPASAGWRPADIASLDVATSSKNLVTITVNRAAR